MYNLNRLFELVCWSKWREMSKALVHCVPCMGGSVGWASGGHAGGREFESGRTITQGLKITGQKVLPLQLPYLPVYKSTSCISRPPFSGSKIEFLIISEKTNEIHTNRNFPKLRSFLPENVLKTWWIKKSRGSIIRSEVYQDHKYLRTYELFNLLEKNFSSFGSKSHCI